MYIYLFALILDVTKIPLKFSMLCLLMLIYLTILVIIYIYNVNVYKIYYSINKRNPNRI